MPRAANGRCGIRKAPTGIVGFDEITKGGLPQGRPILVCGGPGCGKTLFGAEFLVRGATQFGEPGVFMAFEESEHELADNVRSLGFVLESLVRRKKIFVDSVRVERSEFLETGEFNLDGLFIRLADAIGTVGAKRIVLDTLETLFSGLPNEAVLRAELRRVFRWLKDQGITTVITAEHGDGSLTRQGLEEYVSDCVVLLDHRVSEQVATRRLRVVKYRGTAHGTNEYPFIIDENGIEVLPITSIGLANEASEERISSGIPELDRMLGGAGLYRGSTTLVSGTAGTGKSSLAATIARARCARGERVLYFAFEESPDQIRRNMSSIGIDLRTWTSRGLFRCHAARPTEHGLESHLAVMYRNIRDFKPRLVVLDPITNFLDLAGAGDVKSMLLRLIDYLKLQQVTAVFTSLTSGAQSKESTITEISSIVDTWMILRDIESSGERNRALYVLKSRGMNHSNQIREFLLTSEGIRLVEAYIGSEGVLTGSSRIAQEARETAEALRRREDIGRRQQALEQKRLAVEAQIASLRSAFESEAAEIRQAIESDAAREQQLGRDRLTMATSRKANGKFGAPKVRIRTAGNGHARAKEGAP